MLIGPEIINPQLCCPRFLGCGFAGEEPSRWGASETDCGQRRVTAAERARRNQHIEIQLEGPAPPAAVLRIALGEFFVAEEPHNRSRTRRSRYAFAELATRAGSGREVIQGIKDHRAIVS